MMKLTDKYNDEGLKQLYDLYMSAFPKSERKPFEVMLQKRDEGTMELLTIEDSGEFAGLAFMVVYKDLALLDYFAIADEKRNAGLGSKALKALQERYADKRFFLEIETTKEDSEEKELRLRRKAFYIRNEMAEMDFEVNLFGVRMEILTYNCEISYDEYFSTYREVFGERVVKNVSLIQK